MVRKALVEDIATIHALAHATWPVAYGNILSTEQLAYMLQLMYAPEALRRQMEELGHIFHLALCGAAPIGFSAHGTAIEAPLSTKLHKLYVLPGVQGSGAGRTLLEAVLADARRKGHDHVELNVNRFNPSRGFYERFGFRVVRKEVIDIGNGFVMDDHVMRYTFR